ncbi:MAG: hypothetical protein EP330_27290 [Deltaproteobacteria bacterium]|nr:MAG: hypothetical protein EP330_27290 [Deltaproteobacteria bacterium]
MTHSILRPLTLALTLLAACGTVEDTGPTRPAGTTHTISGFAREWVHFGEENRRSVDVDVAFPDGSETYLQILGHFRLDCPEVAGGCDDWDRYGSLRVVENAGTENEVEIEIDRFVTAYKTSFGWTADLTAYGPLLRGDRTLRVFIDTWVTEGHTDGAGWLYTADFEFIGGPAPTPEPVAVVPVWGHTSFNSGDPAAIDERFGGEPVTLSGANHWELRSFITGHGFGGNDNCAEFCALNHTYTVDGEPHSREVWRDNCEYTVTDGPQLGTWTYDRAGWCPGAAVFPWVMPLATEGGQVSVAYDVEDWNWTGSGGQPYYYMSAVAVGYN